MMKILEILAQTAKAAGANVYNIAADCRGETGCVTVNAANPCNDSYSVAKAFTMTAFGMACCDGLTDPSATVADVFADELAAYGIDKSKWAKVAFDDVMRHRAGFESGFLDIDCEDANDWGSDDFLKLVLEHELAYEPGAKYVYSDAAYYLVSRAVTKLTGERVDDYLMPRLFAPLGFREAAWSKCPHGYPIGATGLYIRSDDMVKLGRLYLEGGIWRGRRLFKQSWADTALARGYEFTPHGKGYAKGGMRGQFLYFNFDTDTAVAWHSFDESGKTGALCDALISADI